MTSSMEPAQILRESTAEAHRQIEGAMPVLGDHFTLEQYKLLLEKLFVFYRDFEKALTNSKSYRNLEIQYQRRLKTPMLERDLNFYGLTTAKEFPVWFSEPTLAEILGMLYVVEGSTLGGRIISKKLNRDFGTTAESGGRFFASYQDELAVMWKEFQQTLNQKLDTQDKVTSAVIQANETFTKLGQWLRQPEISALSSPEYVFSPLENRE